MAAKPTMEDVAERAGVSRSLVSLVFRDADNVSDHRRQAVLQAAEELGYRPNRLARNLALGRSMTIGVVVDDLQNPFFAQTFEGVEQQLSMRGYQALLANGARSADRTASAAATFMELQVDGLVLLAPRGDVDYLLAAAGGLPIVLTSCGPSSDLVDSVQVDETVGCRLAIEHLASLGHRSITHIDGGDGASADARRHGYRDAMRHAGLASEIDVLRGDFTHDSGVKAALALVDRNELPTAIFAGNDLLAAGVLMQLERSGLRVPDDISLVGYDDSSLPGFGDATLTTIRQPTRALGQRAAELLVDRMDHGKEPGRHEALAPSLVERSTTQAPATP